MFVAAVAAREEGCCQAQRFHPVSLSALPLAKNFFDRSMRTHKVTNSDAQRSSFDGVANKNLIRPWNGLEFKVLLDEKTDVTRQLASPPEEVVDTHFGIMKTVPQGVASAFIGLGDIFAIGRRARWTETEIVVRQRVEHPHAEAKAAADGHDDRAQFAGKRDVEIRPIDGHVDRFVHVNGLHRATFLWSRSATNAGLCKFGSFPICFGRDWLTIATSAGPTRGRRARALPTGGASHAPAPRRGRFGQQRCSDARKGGTFNHARGDSGGGKIPSPDNACSFIGEIA